MPLLNAFATPSLAAVRFQLLCREYDVNHYYTQQGSDRVLRVDGKRGKRVVPLYLYSRHAFTRPHIVKTLRSLLQTEELVLLVCDLHLVVNGVPLPTSHVNSGKDLFNLLHDSIGNSLPWDFLQGSTPTIPTSSTTVSKDVAKACMGNSIMHHIQTIMYRVPKPDRDEVRSAVFNYLAGNALQFGKAGQYPPIIALFADERVMRLRFASQFAHTRTIEEAVDKYEVDAFDLRYLVATTSGKGDDKTPRSRIIENSKGAKEHGRRMLKDGQREKRYYEPQTRKSMKGS